MAHLTLNQKYSYQQSSHRQQIQNPKSGKIINNCPKKLLVRKLRFGIEEVFLQFFSKKNCFV